MKSRTIVLTLSADRDDVFALLAATENLPRWAGDFCRRLRREGAHWKADTPDGPRFVALLTDLATGVIDWFSGAHPDELELTPLRVLRQPHGAAVTCTVWQRMGESDAHYARRYQALYDGLRGLLACGDEGPTPEQPPLLHAGFVTAKFYETWDFYTTHLGFHTMDETPAEVRLAHPSGAQLSVRRHETHEQFAELVPAADGRGFWLHLAVEDADAEYQRLQAAGVEIAAPPEGDPRGGRRFVVRDPNGILVHLTTAAEADPVLPAVVSQLIA